MKPFLRVVTLMCVLTVCVMAVGLMTPLTDVAAAPLTFIGSLSGANEIPPAATTATGPMKSTIRTAAISPLTIAPAPPLFAFFFFLVFAATLACPHLGCGC